MSAPDEVIVSGAGVVTALGSGCEVLRAALERNEDGLRQVTRFDVSPFRAQLAGLWPGWNGRTPSASVLGAIAAKEAWVNASLDRAEALGASRIAVIVGTCFGEDFHGFSE